MSVKARVVTISNRKIMDSSSSDEDLVMIELLNQRKRRQFWVHPLLRKRNEKGEFHHLIQEMKLYHERFREAFRLSVGQFEDLLQTVGPQLVRQHTNFREPIEPEQRLAVCLRFLATGDSFLTIANSYRLGKSTVAEIVKEVCQVIWTTLMEEYMPQPTEASWRSVAEGFQERWNFPNCLGAWIFGEFILFSAPAAISAIDGKHIQIWKPPRSGTMFRNYKKTFSVVLLALVDHDYKFIEVDVGAYGTNSDGGIFANSKLGRAFAADSLHVPPPAALPGAPELGLLPYTIVGDDAFPLRPYLMKPYRGAHQPEENEIFNYRLSRARRISENAFGILVQRWRVFQRNLKLLPETVDKIIKATCMLCNYRRKNGATGGEEEEDDDDDDSDEEEAAVVHRLQDLPRVRRHGGPVQAMQNRDTLRSYFTSPAGEVDWQYRHVRRGLL